MREKIWTALIGWKISYRTSPSATQECCTQLVEQLWGLVEVTRHYRRHPGQITNDMPYDFWRSLGETAAEQRLAGL
jgi:hypothetical protein